MSAILHSITTSIENSRWEDHLNSWKKNMILDLEKKKEIKLCKIREMSASGGKRNKLKTLLLKKTQKLLNDRKNFIPTSKRTDYVEWIIDEINFPFYSYDVNQDDPVKEHFIIENFRGEHDLLSTCQGSSDYYLAYANFEEFKLEILKDMTNYFDNLTDEDIYWSLYDYLYIGEDVKAFRQEDLKPRDDIEIEIRATYIEKSHYENIENLSLDKF